MVNPIKVRISAVLAFLLPYIATGSGAIASWLLVHLHVLGIFHFTQASVAKTISSAIVFTVVAALTWLSGHVHWLPFVVQVDNARVARKATREAPKAMEEKR